MKTATEKLCPQFLWDEPEGCTSPRGWCVITPETHPDRDQTAFDYFVDDLGGLNVGNYLTYGVTRGPAGEIVHAVCFFHHLDPITHRSSEVRLGYGWFHTIAEAREFIEGNVRAYFGFARDGSAYVGANS